MPHLQSIMEQKGRESRPTITSTREAKEEVSSSDDGSDDDDDDGDDGICLHTAPPEAAAKKVFKPPADPKQLLTEADKALVSLTKIIKEERYVCT